MSLIISTERLNYLSVYNYNRFNRSMFYVNKISSKIYKLINSQNIINLIYEVHIHKSDCSSKMVL